MDSNTLATGNQTGTRKGEEKMMINRFHKGSAVFTRDDLDDLDHHGLTEPADERMVLRGRRPMSATIYERGNRFADVGDYVTSEGNLYLVTATSGTIQTGNPCSGAPNYRAAEVEEADWDELTDEQADAIICTCTVW